MKLSKIVTLLALSFFLIKPGSAQVSIAPSALFIDDQTNIGTVYIANQSDTPQEVSVEFAFGYPASDQEGNVFMNYNDSVKFEKFAINDRVRAFPRSFVLAPRERQTVRFQVRPRPQTESGVYWTRVKFLANPQEPDVELTAEEEEGITTRIAFSFEQIIALLYRVGDVSTGLDVKDIKVQQQQDHITILPHLKRTGNAPYIGSMKATVYDSNDNVVHEQQRTITAYFDIVRRVTIDTNDLMPGEYRVKLTFETRRGDISPTDLVQAPPITEEINVTIE